MSHSVYRIEWDNPKQLYVGRTGRSLDVRYAEHETEDSSVGRAIRQRSPDRAYVVKEFDALEDARREEARLIRINRLKDDIRLLND